MRTICPILTLIVLVPQSFGDDLTADEEAFIASKLAVSYDIPIDFSSGWKNGFAGPLDVDKVSLQIIDGRTMLVTGVSLVGRSGNKYDPQLEFLLKPTAGFSKSSVKYESTYWIEGLSTESYTDDTKTIKIPSSTEFVVSGNKTYETASGASRTVKRLVAVDADKLSPIIEKRLEAAGARTWTHENGKHLRASLKSHVGSKVVLETFDGQSITLRRSQLSDDDQKWLREQRRKP